MSKSEDALVQASYKQHQEPASRSPGAHQSCRKSRIVSWIDACTWLGKWYLGCLIASHSRSSVCCAPTHPCFFWASHLSQCVCLIGVCSRDAPWPVFHQPSNDFFSLFISRACHRHALRARLDAALVAGRKGSAKRARAYKKNAPIRCSGGGKGHSFIIRYHLAHEFGLLL